MNVNDATREALVEGREVVFLGTLYSASMRLEYYLKIFLIEILNTIRLGGEHE